MLSKNVLNEKQLGVLDILNRFSSDFILVGGTAIALQLGHRKSIDLDLFTFNEFDNDSVVRKLSKDKRYGAIYYSKKDHLDLTMNGVKFTFFYYPFEVVGSISFESNIKMPDILSLGAMKAYAIGRRSKWKDYVDLYFILQKNSISEIISKSKEIFKESFNDKLFRTQLSYFDEMDYSEEVEYMPGFEVSEEEVKRFLQEVAIKD